MIDKLLNLFPLAVVAILAIIVLGQYNDARAELRDSKHAYVYATCQASRTSAIITEQECAEAQYNAKVEYLCTMRNSSSINHCWTEDNDQLERY